jgi:hypothetical protein
MEDENPTCVNQWYTNVFQTQYDASQSGCIN